MWLVTRDGRKMIVRPMMIILTWWSFSLSCSFLFFSRVNIISSSWQPGQCDKQREMDRNCRNWCVKLCEFKLQMRAKHTNILHWLIILLICLLSAESPTSHPADDYKGVLNLTDSEKLRDTSVESGKQLVLVGRKTQ